jgi:hypothetical protein
MSDRSSPHPRHRVTDVGRIMRLSEALRDRRRPPADSVYLDGLAARVAAAYGLPRDVAKRRVQQVAVSARTRVDDGADRQGTEREHLHSLERFGGF